jgi:hypothetical protein
LRGLRPGLHPQLSVNGREMVGHGLWGEKELVGNLGVAQTRGDQLQNFCFALRQSRRMGAGRRTWSPPQWREVMDAERTKTLHSECMGWSSPKPFEDGDGVAYESRIATLNQGARRFIRAAEVTPGGG